MTRVHIVTALMALLAAIMFSAPAAAEVRVSFHSWNGSIIGRYPHAFVAFEGTMDSTGLPVNENYGFTARRVTPAVLTSWVKHDVLSEDSNYIAASNRHFTIAVDDETYLAMKAEVVTWRDMPDKFYQLDNNNCAHFVAAIARIAGLDATVPKEYVRRPKSWLNTIVEANPQLNASPID